MSDLFEFCLDKNPEKLFPTAIELDGNWIGINPDFRVVLKIFRLLEDNEVLPMHKYQLLCKWFYNGQGGTPGISEGVLGFAEFAAGKEHEDNEPAERQLDFVFDAKELYLSFLSDYGIDLVEVPFLHYYRFRLLLGGLSPSSALMRKLAIRFMDLNGLKGKELSKAVEAKERVALPERLTIDEIREIREFERVWGK